MNHEFVSHPSKDNHCIECGYPAEKHGDDAVCDCCDKRGNLQIFGKGSQMMLLTRECMERERKILEEQIKEHQSPEKQEQRLAEYKAVTRPYELKIQEAKKIDESLHLSSDIFAAKTITIQEIRDQIWKDENIPADKKFFELVAFCKQRIAHFQEVIFDLDKKKIEAYSEQKAWHVYMNDYANKLRADEKEQLRIQDINYDVKVPKPVTPKAIKTNPKAVSKEELRKAVNALNAELKEAGAKSEVAESMIAMLQVSKNWTLEQAINWMRLKVKEGLSMG